MARDNSNDATPWAVYCKGELREVGAKPCSPTGLMFLREPEYEQQMNQANAFWRCPQCGGRAEWDDDCQETNPPEEEDERKDRHG